MESFHRKVEQKPKGKQSLKKDLWNRLWNNKYGISGKTYTLDLSSMFRDQEEEDGGRNIEAESVQLMCECACVCVRACVCIFQPPLPLNAVHLSNSVIFPTATAQQID